VDVAEPLSFRHEQTGRMLLSLLFPVAMLVITVALIGSLQVGKAIRPITSLSEDVDNRDANDLRQIDFEQIPHELAPLTDALNRLLRRLGRAIEREREFAENAAHELRTPVAALKARAQILQSRLSDDAEAKEDLEQLLLSVDRAGNVVDRLLELARLSANQLHPAEFNLSSVIDDEARLIAPSILGKGLSFTADISPGIKLVGIEEALRVAVRNLLINAAKFTLKGGTVTVFLAIVDESIKLSVSDSGPGVLTGQEGLLFERFWRGTGDAAGSGLGLALVQRAAAVHRGIAIASNLKPHGLSVSITVPRQADLAVESG
jgi:two-component system sensor histidine kinase QseC